MTKPNHSPLSYRKTKTQIGDTIMLTYYCNHCQSIACYEVQDDIYGDSHIEWLCPKCLKSQKHPKKSHSHPPHQKPYDLPF